MKKYDVYVVGENKPCLSFESDAAFQKEEPIFIKQNGDIYVLRLAKRSHDLTNGEHVIRLNCHKSLYKSDNQK